MSTSSSNFQSIFDAALSDYAKKTGIDLATYPFARTFENCHSASDILGLLQDRATQFCTYRDGNHKLINYLKPVVQVLHSLSGVLAEATAIVSRLILSRAVITRSRPRCHSNLPKQSLSELMFSLPYVSFVSFVASVDKTSLHIRPPSESAQVTTHSLTYLNASETSSIVYMFISRSLSLLQCPMLLSKLWSRCYRYFPWQLSRSRRDGLVCGSILYKSCH